jgi:hypothetical protein
VELLPHNKTCDFQELQKISVEFDGLKQEVEALAEVSKSELKTNWQELRLELKQELQSVAAASQAQPPQRFCPWDARHSAFVEAGTDVDFGHGQTACVDAIVYGYDLMFERMALWRKMKWLGTSMQQDPNDAIVLQEMLWRVKPDVLIELGTNTGGGALCESGSTTQCRMNLGCPNVC